MARRGAGLAGIQRQQLNQAQIKEKGVELAQEQLTQLTRQLDDFKKNLEEFAARHRNKIQKNAQFRSQFTQMCAAIGVDPLASSKGFWAEALGVGNFYYELAIKVVEICIANSARTGGLMELGEIRRRIEASRSRFETYSVSDEDVMRALRCLEQLGNGFTVLRVGEGPLARVLVQCVPSEANSDLGAMLALATGASRASSASKASSLSSAPSDSGFVTPRMLREALGWTSDRISLNWNQCLQEGLAWLDEQYRAPDGANEHALWFPSLSQLSSANNT